MNPPHRGSASLRHDSCAQDGQLARVLVHQEVEVSAAIARFDVGDAVEGVGTGTPDLGQHLDRVDRERRLAAPRLHRLAGGPHDVAERDVRGARRGQPGRRAGRGQSGRRDRGKSACRARAAP